MYAFNQKIMGGDVLAEILKVENLTKIYPNGVVANDGVNLSVGHGEIHAICGENGAGKSTLMKMLFGLEQPESGTISINGEAVVIHNPSEAIKLGIGMVHQHFMLVESMTVAENVVLGIEPKKLFTIDKEMAERQTKEVSDKYNLQMDPTATVRDLSVGIKQKIEIVKALHRGAKLLILDEPTAVLTPQETAELFVELKHLRDAGHTILFISHKLGEVKEICSRVTIMRAGKSVGTYDLEELSEADISRLMVGRDVVLKIDKEPAKPTECELSVRNLGHTNSHGRKTLKNVSFDVRRGEILGIAGIEGNGQRELVEIVAGIISSQEGTVKLGGVDITKDSIKARRKKGMTHIPSDRMVNGVASSMSIRHNMMSDKTEDARYTGRLFFKNKTIESDMQALSKDYLVKCSGIEQAVGMLSGGNIQKVVVAREMSSEPNLLLADQPTRGIDVGAAEFIRRKIVELRDGGTAVMLVTADLNEALELADSIIVMQEGEIVAYFPDVDNLTEDELGFYMLGVKRQTAEQIGGVVHG